MGKVIFDFNNLAIRCIHISDVKQVNSKTKEIDNIDWDYWRFVIFSSVYGSLFKINNLNTVVLAVDDKNSWRYSVWPRYKEDRKKKKENDNFPWDIFFQKYQEVVEDFKNHLPFKVISTPRAEADDIIATIALQTTDTTEIVSTDSDFLQLCSDKIKIYNPLKQTHVSHPDPKFFLIEQCFVGQSKDSIFNIITPDDHPSDKRKPGFGPKAFEKAVAYGWEKWIQDNKKDHNFKRNLQLIDLTRTPEEIKQAIMNDYNSYTYPHPKNIWKFIKSNGWPDMIDNFTQLENKLLQLY